MNRDRISHRLTLSNENSVIIGFPRLPPHSALFAVGCIVLELRCPVGPRAVTWLFKTNSQTAEAPPSVWWSSETLRRRSSLVQSRCWDFPWSRQGRHFVNRRSGLAIDPPAVVCLTSVEPLSPSRPPSLSSVAVSMPFHSMPRQVVSLAAPSLFLVTGMVPRRQRCTSSPSPHLRKLSWIGRFFSLSVSPGWAEGSREATVKGSLLWNHCAVKK